MGVSLQFPEIVAPLLHLSIQQTTVVHKIFLELISLQHKPDRLIRIREHCTAVCAR